MIQYEKTAEIIFRVPYVSKYNYELHPLVYKFFNGQAGCQFYRWFLCYTFNPPK